MTRKVLAAITFISLAVSCNEVEELLTFEINDSTDITIQSTSPLNLPVGVATPPVTSNSKQQYENNNTAASLVKDVRLQQLQLDITAPASKTFSFLKKVTIYISTEQSNEIVLASLDNVSSSSASINLTPTKEKLDVYAKAESYSLRTEVTTDETLTQDVEIRVNLRFKVTADTF